MMKTAVEKLHSREAKVAVIGMGYVGLPLAVEIASAGFVTTGIDLVTDKIKSINAGVNYIKDVDDVTLRNLVADGKLRASSDFSLLSDFDYIAIAVPTPLGKGKIPDISFVASAVGEVSQHLRKGQVIILESTTYPGTTEEVVLPLLEESGLKVGEDFHLAYSPERVDPGNKSYGLKNTPKVIGGVTPNCTEAAQSLYATFVDHLVPVSSTRAAEMVKILENTFRAINIGLANEVAIICNHLDIDTWEVIDAAASKPFGFMPFYPGPGLGGHCIPVDPHYLVWKLKSLDYNPRFIQLADEVNSSMPKLVVDKISHALNFAGKPLKDSKILVLGVAYKPDVDDYRESPSLDVIQLLQKSGAIVSYHDPHVPSLKVSGINLESCPINGTLSDYDCVVLLTQHSVFKMEEIVMKSQLLVDTRNATRDIRGHSSKIVKL